MAEGARRKGRSRGAEVIVNNGPATGTDSAHASADRNPAEQIVAVRKRPLIVWSDPDKSIRPHCIRQLRTVFDGVDKVPGLDLLIHSPGGYIESAYHALRLIRRHAEHVTALVPCEAKSAATLLVLGADDVLFGSDGELGPLDAQLPDPRGFSSPLSALNEFKSLEYIREYSMETFDMIVLLMMGKAGMDVPYAVEQARSIISAFTTPLYSQIRPQDLGSYRRSLAVGEEYAKRAMLRWAYSNMTEESIKQIVNRLVWEYPAHDFVIDCEEAQELGLHAQHMSRELDVLCSRAIRTTGAAIQGFGFAKNNVNTGDAREVASHAHDDGDADAIVHIVPANGHEADSSGQSGARA